MAFFTTSDISRIFPTTIFTFYRFHITLLILLNQRLLRLYSLQCLPSLLQWQLLRQPHYYLLPISPCGKCKSLFPLEVGSFWLHNNPFLPSVNWSFQFPSARLLLYQNQLSDDCTDWNYIYTSYHPSCNGINDLNIANPTI